MNGSIDELVYHSMEGNLERVRDHLAVDVNEVINFASFTPFRVFLSFYASRRTLTAMFVRAIQSLTLFLCSMCCSAWRIRRYCEASVGTKGHRCES